MARPVRLSPRTGLSLLATKKGDQRNLWLQSLRPQDNLSGSFAGLFESFPQDIVRRVALIRSGCVASILLTLGWFMTDQLDVASGRDVIARWCALAEQRLEYLTELLESGRWRRFHSEPAFLENMREAKAAVQTWRDLSSREASRDNRPIDMSWLGRKSMRREIWRDPVRLPQVAENSRAEPSDASTLAGAGSGSVRQSFDAREIDAIALTGDPAPTAERYPLLRNRF